MRKYCSCNLLFSSEIEGYCVEATYSSPVDACEVEVGGMTNYNVVANEVGHFILSLPGGTYFLTVRK